MEYRVFSNAVTLTAPLAFAFVIACDSPKTNATPAAAASASAVTATGSAPVASATATAVAEKPRELLLELDGTTLTIAGERSDIGTTPGKTSAELLLKGKTEAPTATLVVQRSVKMPLVTWTVAALRAAKSERKLTIKTATRDGKTEPLFVALGANASSIPACAPSVSIAKDGSILTWPAGGGTATRFSRGMAGPDITRGSEGFAKLGAACDSKLMVLGADDTMTWGLAFDIAQAGQTATRASAKSETRASEVVIPEKLVAGKKVELEGSGDKVTAK